MTLSMSTPLMFGADAALRLYGHAARPARFVHADKVIKNGKLVGVSTSRGYSYYFREMLSLCTLDAACCEPGSEVMVIWGNPGGPQKEIRAKVAPAPYKTDNRKLDVDSLPPPKQVAQFSPTA